MKYETFGHSPKRNHKNFNCWCTFPPQFVLLKSLLSQQKTTGVEVQPMHWPHS